MDYLNKVFAISCITVDKIEHYCYICYMRLHCDQFLIVLFYVRTLPGKGCRNSSYFFWKITFFYRKNT